MMYSIMKGFRGVLSFMPIKARMRDIKGSENKEMGAHHRTIQEWVKEEVIIQYIRRKPSNQTCPPHP